MRKFLVTCGCSFTEQDGWAKHIKQVARYDDLLNLAIGGGTNDTQINRINDFVLTHNRPSFDLIWQMTYPIRTPNVRLSPDHPDVINQAYMPKKDRGFTYAHHSPVRNYIDDQAHLDVLYEDYNNKVNNFFYINPHNDVSRLLCSILLLKKLADRILVFFGVDDVDQQIVSRTEDFFTREKILFIPYSQNLLRYVKNKNLRLAEDNWHPARESYITYANEVLLPVLHQSFDLKEHDD